MGRLFDWLQGLPKPVLILLAIAVVGLLGYGMFMFVAGDKLEKPETSQEGSVLLDFPDGKVESSFKSKLEELEYADKHGRKRSTAEDYWSSLGGEKEAGGLMVGDEDVVETEGGVTVYKGEILDPSVYTELDIYCITKGLKTKEEVDQEKAKLRKMDEENARNMRKQEKQMESMYSDSAYYARMEKAFEIANKYAQKPEDMQAQVEPSEKVDSVPELKRIEINVPDKIASTMLPSNDIISSLDSPSGAGTRVNDDGSISTVPAKATFLKSEKLVSGQRVIMRLIQDLYLSDGTLIPSNTHVSGICTLKDRLNVTISTINYGGRIYYTNIDIYDNDGTEGIYCPVIVDNKAGKSTKRMAKQIGNTLTNLIGSAASMANPYVGIMASRGLNEVTRSIDSNGNVSVSVSAGYEFYVFENTEDKKKK